MTDTKLIIALVEKWKRDVQPKITDERDREATTKLIECLLNRLCIEIDGEHPEDGPPVSRSEVVADVYANKITAEMMQVIRDFDFDIMRWSQGDPDEDMVKMFEADKAYGEKCLATFGRNDDMSRLWNDLLNQDTAARDRYSVVFDLIMAALNDIEA